MWGNYLKADMVHVCVINSPPMPQLSHRKVWKKSPSSPTRFTCWSGLSREVPQGNFPGSVLYKPAQLVTFNAAGYRPIVR